MQSAWRMQPRQCATSGYCSGALSAASLLLAAASCCLSLLQYSATDAPESVAPDHRTFLPYGPLGTAPLPVAARSRCGQSHWSAVEWLVAVRPLSSATRRGHLVRPVIPVARSTASPLRWGCGSFPAVGSPRCSGPAGGPRVRAGQRHPDCHHPFAAVAWESVRSWRG